MFRASSPPRQIRSLSLKPLTNPRLLRVESFDYFGSFPPRALASSRYPACSSTAGRSRRGANDVLRHVIQPVARAKQLISGSSGEVCLKSEGSTPCQTIQTRNKTKEAVGVVRAVSNPAKNPDSSEMSRARSGRPKAAMKAIRTESRTNKAASGEPLSWLERSAVGSLHLFYSMNRKRARIFHLSLFASSAMPWMSDS